MALTGACVMDVMRIGRLIGIDERGVQCRCEPSWERCVYLGRRRGSPMKSRHDPVLSRLKLGAPAQTSMDLV